MSDWGISESDGPGPLIVEWTITLSGFDPSTDWRDHPALDEIGTVVHDIAERHDLDVGTAGRLVLAWDRWTTAVLNAADEVARCSAYTAPEEIMRRIDILRSTLEQEGGEPHA